MDAPVARSPQEPDGWRRIPFRVREHVRLARIWFAHLTFNQRAVGLLLMVLILALVRSEVRVTHATHVAQHATAQAEQASSEVKGLLQHQTANRVNNVKVWCSRFVALEGVIATYLVRAKAPPLPLPPLTAADCESIEYGTAASAK